MNQLESMVAEAERCCSPGLPYHVVTLCTGVTLASSATKCYDLEVWLPSYNNCGARLPAPTAGTSRHAARTSATRTPRSSRVRVWVHTNGSALPLAAPWPQSWENYQERRRLHHGAREVLANPHMRDMEVIKLLA